MDDDYGASFEQCIGACSHRNGRAIGCHTMCADSVPAVLRASFLKILAYQYEPSPANVVRRYGWICSQWASTPILRYTRPLLPQEIRLEVARHLLHGPVLRRYAVALTCTWKKNMDCGNAHIRVSAGIWANFINFEGVRYISSLSNTRGECHTELLFTPSSSRPVDVVYIAENHLGTVQVLFGSSGQTPSVQRRQGLWWRLVRLHEREPTLTIQTDVSCCVPRLLQS